MTQTQSVFDHVPPAQAGSWWNQTWSVLLQPARFFRALSTISDVRQWVWMGLIILILTGISAARADSVAGDNADTSSEQTVDIGGPLPGDPFTEGGSPVDIPQQTPAASSSDNGSDVSAKWTTALIAMSNIVVAWLLLVALLCEVSLIKGKAPRLTHNFQIAVWASAPLALMAALQIVYYAAGGQAGKPGLAGLLPEWDRYSAFSRSTQAVLLSAATRTTLFGLWTLILAYLGARFTLKGHWASALSVVLIWSLLIVVIPVVAKTIEAPKAGDNAQPTEFAYGYATRRDGSGHGGRRDVAGGTGCTCPGYPGDETLPMSKPSANGGTTNNGTMLATQNLQKSFRLGDQWVRALDGVNLHVPKGQFIGIMGPSGSGKSTLLYLLGGLDRPTQGEIIVGGQRLDGLRGDDLAHYRSKMVGFIFQAFHLVPTMTALENVAMPGIFAGIAREQREQRAHQLLVALGMADRMKHRPSQLSGGQQQRVAIARALFNNPPIIMADEPTGALDSKTGQVVMHMLRRLCTAQGKTIVVVTHDPGVARYADRILHLKDGHIVDDETVAAKEQIDVPL